MRYAVTAIHIMTAATGTTSIHRRVVILGIRNL